MKTDQPQWYAHSANKLGEWQLQHDHLHGTTKRMVQFAIPLDFGDEVELTGNLHDAGKYSELFQDRLRGKAAGIDHWSAGAWLALYKYRSIAAALAIQGHHIGLQCGLKDALLAMSLDRLSSNHPLGLRVSETDADRLSEALATDRIRLQSVTKPIVANVSDTIRPMMDVRMLFSALVDADFLDTEEHFTAGTGMCRPVGPQLMADKAWELLSAHMDQVRAMSGATRSVADLRNDLFQTCVSAADAPVGLWTMSAPTGAGKTLAMLAWALMHASANGLQRVVVVIPYLSIIEQTAEVYRRILSASLGPNYVLEHHSMREADNEAVEHADDARLLAENWDAPLVITTSVQMLESLFSNRPSACRKLHRLAKSVILFDEVQTLPSDLAVPTLASLAYLSERYGSSVLFATATQPAFEHLSERAAKLNGGLAWQPKEIADPKLNLFGRARRVAVRWPEQGERMSWTDLASRIAEQKQVLCIVNLKRHAHELLDKLDGVENLYHLSTAMCPQHRKVVLAKVRELLRDGLPCKLISTQCVEAGCDVSFPNAWRAFADLCSIAQAAGRCNRGGEWGMREMRVFMPEDAKYPSCLYEQSADITKTLLNELGPDAMDINDPELFRKYYRRLYDVAAPQSGTRSKDIEEAIKRQDYAALAKLYRLIEQDTINVLVPYDEDIYTELADAVRTHGLSSNWVRRARPYSVSLFRPKSGSPVEDRLEPVRTGREECRDWFIYCDPDPAHSEYTRWGLIPPDAAALWIA